MSAVKANYAELRAKQRETYTHNIFPPGKPSAIADPAEVREREYEARWRWGGFGFLAAYEDLHFNDASNETAAEFARAKVRSIVRNAVIAEKLCPTFAFGCKRLCVDTDYFETFNRENVSLIDVTETPIERIVPVGAQVGGRLIALDVLVCATGYDAMTGALLAIDIRNGAGETLRDKWLDGPRAYLGLAMAGFPNLFAITGPGSPSVLTNMVLSIEQHVDYIADCVAFMRKRGLVRIEPDAGAEEQWVAHVADVAGGSLRPSCNSWYVGANVPGKPRVFMPYFGGVPAYRRKCEDVAAKGYAGFQLS